MDLLATYPYPKSRDSSWSRFPAKGWTYNASQTRGKKMEPYLILDDREGDKKMKRLNVATGMVAIILTLLSPATIFAQAVANAQIHGVITDPSGAVVPGAKVKATQTETGQVRNTLSTSDGSYILSS